MANAMPANQLLERAASILPISGEDLIYKGVFCRCFRKAFQPKKEKIAVGTKGRFYRWLAILRDPCRGYDRPEWPLRS